MARPVKFAARRPVGRARAASAPKFKASGDIFDYSGSQLSGRGKGSKGGKGGKGGGS